MMNDAHPDLGHALRGTMAIILAGGKGSRLLDLGAYQAKPAIPFGGSHRLIDFPLSNCINSGIRRVGVATQYRAQTLLRHLNHSWGFLHHELGEFIEPWPAEQESDGSGWYMGTADAIFRNLHNLGPSAPSHILILAGDHVYKQDYRMMLAEHIEHGADVTIACVDVPLDQAHKFGIVTANTADTVTGFEEKPANPVGQSGAPETCLASMGIYLFKAAFLAELLYEDHHNSASSHDFGHDLLPRLVGRTNFRVHRFANSCRATAERAEPYWRDVGTLDAYWRANLDLASMIPPLDLFDASWPIRSAPAQQPSARVTLAQGGAIEGVVLAPGVTIENATVTDSVLSADVHIAPKATIEKSVLLPGTVVGAGAQLHKVITSEGCTIPAGLAVGIDAREDARWFTRTEEGVTLVTPHGLQQRAIHQKMSQARAPYTVRPTPQLDMPEPKAAAKARPRRPAQPLPLQRPLETQS